MVMLPESEQADYEAGYFGDPEMYATMEAFNTAMADAGVMLSGDGLHPTSRGARVAFSDKGAAATDGPFTESKELFGGYWIIQTSSREEAVGWIKRAPMQPGEVIVLRQIMEMDEFTEEIQNAAGKSPNKVN